jgi:hypothetical protein
MRGRPPAAPEGGAVSVGNPVAACHAWHGREVDEVPAPAIRVINSCQEAMYRGF